MADNDDRIRCRYCGSNNFLGSPTCWQCNRPLIVSSPESNPVAANLAPKSSDPASYPIFTTQIDRQAGDRAAIALGLLFPIFGYPIGMAFIMLDEPRKVQLGKLAILWSTIGTVISLVITLLFLAPLANIVKQALPSGSPTHLSLPSDDGS